MTSLPATTSNLSPHGQEEMTTDDWGDGLKPNCYGGEVKFTVTLKVDMDLTDFPFDVQVSRLSPPPSRHSSPVRRPPPLTDHFPEVLSTVRPHV